MVGNRNQLSKPEAEEIIECLEIEQFVEADWCPFGDGHSAEKIVNELKI